MMGTELEIMKDMALQVKPPDTRYLVTDARDAETTANEVLAIRGMKEQLNVIEAAELQKVSSKCADIRQKLNEVEVAYMPLLGHWYKSQYKKGKTIRVGEVELYSRKIPDKLDIIDKEKCLEYCLAHDIGVNTKTVVTTTPDKKALMRHLETTGEIPDAVTYIPPAERFDIKGIGEKPELDLSDRVMIGAVTSGELEVE